MIHVEGLHKRYGERILFEDVSWHVKKRDRIGLSGPNGSGKTTLLRMLAGLQEADSGSIRMASDTTIGYLPQDGIVHHGRTVYDEVVLAFQELLALKDEQHRIEDALAHATEDGEGHDKLLERYAEVTDRFKHLGGWEIDARVADVLKGLGCSLAEYVGTHKLSPAVNQKFGNSRLRAVYHGTAHVCVIKPVYFQIVAVFLKGFPFCETEVANLWLCKYDIHIVPVVNTLFDGKDSV